MKDNKKTYIPPMIELVIIHENDIILTSGEDKYDPSGILSENGDHLF
ncbi:MAG: hypothetical protein MJ216_02960 [Bacilli bacterium]|nr:hypothetical protein [Bacilli bacterium]